MGQNSLKKSRFIKLTMETILRLLWKILLDFALHKLTLLKRFFGLGFGIQTKSLTMLPHSQLACLGLMCWILGWHGNLLVVGNYTSRINHDVTLKFQLKHLFELQKMLDWFQLKQECSRKLHELIQSNSLENKLILDTSTYIQDIIAYLIS